jgi:hypothetical protein
MNTPSSRIHHPSHPGIAGKRNLLLLTTLLLAATAVGPATADMTIEYGDVAGQGPLGPVVAYDGAKLVRADDKLIISVTIPTPEPGSYNYPGANPFNPAAIPGNPEAYSLWAFVFNYPENCAVPHACLPSDVAGSPAAAGGAFNAAGHLVSGPVLQLNGSVTLNSETFGGGGSPLLEPHTAEVHLAIAPHGAIQPEAMPGMIKTPIGNPGFWWLARFAVE